MKKEKGKEKVEQRKPKISSYDYDAWSKFNVVCLNNRPYHCPDFIIKIAVHPLKIIDTANEKEGEQYQRISQFSYLISCFSLSFYSDFSSTDANFAKQCMKYVRKTTYLYS